MIVDKLQLKGKFTVSHYRNGQLINEFAIKNAATNVGKNKALDILFGADSKISDWYAGLIDSSGYTAVAAADTMASHAGWTEFTDYDETARLDWNPGAASSQAIANSTPMTFTISQAGTVKGIFITSSSTKSGTAGTLWATALFATEIGVNDNDELKITYTVSV